jgi:hypothetical protein
MEGMHTVTDKRNRWAERAPRRRLQAGLSVLAGIAGLLTLALGSALKLRKDRSTTTPVSPTPMASTTTRAQTTTTRAATTPTTTRTRTRTTPATTKTRPARATTTRKTTTRKTTTDVT